MAENLPVENNILESVPDDAAQAQDNAAELSEITETAAEQPQAPAQNEAQPAKEPGWIKQRVNAAVERAVADAVAKTKAEMESAYQAQLRPLRDSIIEREADDLVANGQIKDREMALSYARMKHGVFDAPAPAPQEAAVRPTASQPRDEQGRFASQDSDVQARANMLAAQARAITAAGGPDVMKAYREDENVRNRVLSGEWDFSDVAQALREPARSVPTPVRAANGQQVSRGAIAAMTDEEFDRLNAEIRRGKRFKT